MKPQQLAQNPTGLGQIGGPGLGPLANIKTGLEALTQLASVISLIIGVLTIIAGIYFMIQFLLGGLNWIGASGDKGKLQSAQDRMSQAIIGLIIVVAAYAVVSIIGKILGIENILLQNPQALFDQLQLK